MVALRPLVRFWLSLVALLLANLYLALTTPVVDWFAPLVLGLFLLPAWIIASFIWRQAFRWVVLGSTALVLLYAWYVVKSADPAERRGGDGLRPPPPAEHRGRSADVAP